MNKPRTIYLDDATWEGLRKQAFERRVTVSSIIREAVTENRPVPAPFDPIRPDQRIATAGESRATTIALRDTPPTRETPVSDRPSGVQGMSQRERDAVLRKLSK